MEKNDVLWDVQVDVFGAWIHLLQPTWSFTDKNNPHFRLWYVLQGEIAADLRGEKHAVREGEIVLWPAAEHVHFHNKGGTDAHIWSILFALQSKTGYHYRSLPGVKQMPTNLDMTWVQAQMEQVILEMEQRQVGYQMTANAAVQQLLVHLIRRGNYEEPRSPEAWIDPEHKSYLLGRIVQLLHDEPMRFPTTKQMADIVSVSEVHLRRLFHKHYNVSPNQFVRQYKIRESQHLLRDTSLTISEIAYMLGFESANYFSKVFLKRCGYSPSDFRRMIRKYNTAEKHV